MIDDSWIVDKDGNPCGLGEKVESMRKWGMVPKYFDKQGNRCETYGMVLDFCPDPWNRPDDVYLVVSGRTWGGGPTSPRRDEIIIQTEGGDMRTLTPDELAAYRSKAHWKYHKETQADMVAAIKKALGGVPQGYQAARVTE